MQLLVFCLPIPVPILEAKDVREVMILLLDLRYALLVELRYGLPGLLDWRGRLSLWQSLRVALLLEVDVTEVVVGTHLVCRTEFLIDIGREGELTLAFGDPASRHMVVTDLSVVLFLQLN